MFCAFTLAPLDLSRAFETIDNGILFDRLRELGVQGNLFVMVLRFLPESVPIGGKRSSLRSLLCVVLQSLAIFYSYLTSTWKCCTMLFIGTSEISICWWFSVIYLHYFHDKWCHHHAPQSLEAVRVWMGKIRLQVSPGKWLWVLEAWIWTLVTVNSWWRSTPLERFGAQLGSLLGLKVSTWRASESMASGCFA